MGAVLGIAGLWAAYTAGLWGYCLVTHKAGQGKHGSVTIGQMVVPSKWAWPPASSGSSAGSSSTSSSASKAKSKSKG